MIVELIKTYKFDAAHRLPFAGETHKCSNMHGHSWKVEICVKGEVCREKGWFIDYSQINSAWKPIDAILDHSVLNEIDGLENPTSEILAGWLWDKLVTQLPGLSSITIYESETSRCIYRGQ